MTVAWETTYAAVNLYVLFNGSVDGQTQLAGTGVSKIDIRLKLTSASES